MSTPVSASKAALLAACAYSFRHGTHTVASKGKAAADGDAFHRLIAPVVETLKGELPEKCTLWMKRRMIHATAWIAKNHVPGWRAEVAWAYDPESGKGRVLGYNINREYEKHGKLPHELAGSADIAWVDGDTIEIRDHKTGRTIGASWEAQAEWLCVFGAAATGATRAHAVALHVTDTGVEECGEYSFDEVGLWRIAEQIRIDTRAIADAWPTPSAACDNCYCEARDTCESYIQLRQKEAS